MRKLLLCAGLACALSAGGAQAHVAFAEPQAMAGAHWAGALRVGHGCDGSATTSLRVEIPAGVVTAKPRPKPGWTVLIEREPLAQPVPGEGGKMLTERVKAITWTGRLPDDQFEEFELAAKLAGAGEVLVFPVVQTCERGELRWTEPPAADGARSPQAAPVLRLHAADPAMHH